MPTSSTSSQLKTQKPTTSTGEGGTGHAYLFYLHVPKGKYVDCIVSSLNSTQQFDRHAAVNFQSIIGPVLVAFSLQRESGKSIKIMVEQKKKTNKKTYAKQNCKSVT